MNYNKLITLITATDSYKITQPRMRTNVEYMYSYREDRKGAKFPYSRLFGLQQLIVDFLMGPVPTKEEIDEADKFFAIHFGNDKVFKRDMWDYITELGYFPLKEEQPN